MRTLRREELWVKACIEAALPGVMVKQHDDGSRPKMYDLELFRSGDPFGACEVTAAADAESIELWNLVNGREERWIEPDLLGGWMVTITPRCRSNRLSRALPDLLRTLERCEIGPEREEATRRLRVLGVVAANRSDTAFPGSIYVTLRRPPERTSGSVSSGGEGLTKWLDAWVREEEQAHNLEKLVQAEHAERHLFVLLPVFTTAPFSASDMLIRSEAPVPRLRPSLPKGLTHVWLMSTLTSGYIFHWGMDHWQRFSKVFDLKDD